MNLPLQNRTILITRTKSQAHQLRLLLEEAGARVLDVPTIEIRPRRSTKMDSALEKLQAYDWLIFTSANGVRVFMQRAHELDLLSAVKDHAASLRICTIGPATAGQVRAYGLSVELIPQVYQAEGVLEDFLRYHEGNIRGLRILLPRASQAREILPQTLRKHGAEVDVLPVYDTALPEENRARLRKLLASGSPDLVTFTSSSTVRNFAALAEGTDLSRFRCAVIGPITAATAREHGLTIAVEAKRSSIPDLVEAIEQYFEQLTADH